MRKNYVSIKFKNFKFNDTITISKINSIFCINSNFTYKIVQTNNNIKLSINFNSHSKAIYPIISNRKYYILSNILTHTFNKNITATIVTDHIYPMKDKLLPIINYGRVSSFISNKIETSTGRIS